VGVGAGVGDGAAFLQATGIRSERRSIPATKNKAALLISPPFL